MESSIFDQVYRHVEAVDKKYSKVMNSRESIKLTTIKPSGTLSLLAGVTPGCHPAFAEYYIRRIRFAADDSLIDILRSSGHHVEPLIRFDGTRDVGTMVVDFPVKTPEGTILKDEISAVEQIDYAMFYQRHWSDNSVSVTVYYQEEELPDIHSKLKTIYNDEVKTLSFLLHTGHGFKQAPMEEINEAKYNEMVSKCSPITNIKDDQARDTVDSLECSGGSCPIK
jgi:ribonucleoside-triphosphate reductase